MINWSVSAERRIMLEGYMYSAFEVQSLCDHVHGEILIGKKTCGFENGTHPNLRVPFLFSFVQMY